MEIGFSIDIVGIILAIILIYGMLKIADELGIISTYLMRIRDEIKELKNTEVVDERVTRRDINGDYGFRNPLKRSTEGYRVNQHGQYVPMKPNVVGEDEDV